MNAKSIVRDRLRAIPDLEAFAPARMVEARDKAKVAVEQARDDVHRARSNSKAAAKRALSKAQKALAQIERDMQAEVTGEIAAPAVQRRDLVDRGVLVGEEKGEKVYGDVTLREARIETAGKKAARVVTPLDRMKNRGVISVNLYKAGRDYLRAWEVAHMDAYPVGIGGDGGRCSPSSGNRRVERPVGSRAELQRMRLIIRASGTGLIEHVVVHERDLDTWTGCTNRHQAMGAFKHVLGLLVEKRPEPTNPEAVEDGSVDRHDGRWQG